MRLRHWVMVFLALFTVLFIVRIYSYNKEKIHDAYDDGRYPIQYRMESSSGEYESPLENEPTETFGGISPEDSIEVESPYKGKSTTWTREAAMGLPPVQSSSSSSDIPEPDWLTKTIRRRPIPKVPPQSSGSSSSTPTSRPRREALTPCNSTMVGVCVR